MGSMSIKSFSATTSTTQAGGHPDWAVSFSLSTGPGSQTAQSVTFDAPGGAVLLPTAVPSCTNADLALNECPIYSQVGLVTVRAGHEGNPEYLLGTVPLFAMEHSGEFGRLAFTLPLPLDTSVEIPVSLREAGDYGPRLRFEQLPQSSPIARIGMKIWGVPASTSHDEERFSNGSPGHPAECAGLEDASCIPLPNQSGVLLRPFTRNPTLCEAPLSANLAVRTYEAPSVAVEAESSLPQITGCNQVSFQRALSVEPTTTEAYAPSGLDIDLGVDQAQSVNSPSHSELSWAALIMPVEMGINPDVPEEEVPCSDEEAGFGSEEPADCPPGSQLGTATLELVGVPTSLSGEIYFSGEEPEEILLALVVRGGGVELKLPMALVEVPETGQLALVLAQPQIPIADYQLHLAGGDYGLLRTPLHCGTYSIEDISTPSDENFTSSEGEEPFTISGGPGGAPCVGEAEHVTVALSPATILADGAAHALATVRVSDAHDTGIPEEDLHLTSSDPGEKVGEVTDNEDGTYSATITASTTPGTATITATDLSAGTSPIGTASLLQLAPPASPSRGRPRVSFSRKPPRTTANRRPRFNFAASPAPATLTCKLDRGPYRPCSSPLVLPKLSLGAHTLSVRATSAAGAGAPATWHFHVVLPHRHRKAQQHREPS